MKTLIAAVLLFALAPSVALAQQKHALVIGNGAYAGTGLPALKNPVNDASDIAAALKALGFEVDLVLNAGLDRMESAVDGLKRRLSASRSAYGLFFYAGHGVQANGRNYLIPVGGSIPSEAHLRERAVSLNVILDNLNEAGNELNMVVLDACRDNPFGWARSGTRSLSPLNRASSGTGGGSIVMYSAAAGQVAADGSGRNSPFAEQFLSSLKTPGLSVRDVFDKTGQGLHSATGGKQRPEFKSDYFAANSAYLGARPAAAQTAPPAPATNTAPAPAAANFPAAAPATTTNPAPAANMAPAAASSAALPAGFVRVEGGTFQMGSSSGQSDEKPVHAVTVKSFSMSKYPVTQKEWFDVMGTTVRQQRDKADRSRPIYGEGDNYPMYNVSWHHAIEYCNRRSKKEGLAPVYSGIGDNITFDRGANGYRLPTEAEWEYAAKGGRNQPYPAFEFSGSNSADEVAWYNKNSGNSTHPVDQKAPNALGLYDMSGNVWEWCWDWYGNYSSASQTDPVGASSGHDRVIRGGSWGSSGQFVRSAFRSFYSPSYRGFNLGFRILRP
jgi:formylglycine-generating enzyme required for sulfatase activity